MPKSNRKNKYKILAISGGAILAGAAFGAGFGSLATSNSKPALNQNTQSSIVNQAGVTDNPALGATRVFKNTSFSGIPVKGTNPGALVLTGTDAITRTDYYGNVLWRFSPSVADDAAAGAINPNGSLQRGDRGALVSPNGVANFRSDIQGKMVVEARQDASLPNIFYLLLIPSNYETVNAESTTIDQIDSAVNMQATVLVLSEDLSNPNIPFGVVAASNIKPSDMIKNYPSAWTQNTSKSYFSLTNHPNYFDGTSNDISLPWKIYLASVGNMYANNGQVIMAGGNGTIFDAANDQDVLSMGMFRVNFNFATISSNPSNASLHVTADGFPYALILSGIVSPFGNTTLTNLPIGQDQNFQYVPRMAVSGLVPATDPNTGAVSSLSLVGTITIGTNADQGADSFSATRSGITGAVATSDLGSNAVTNTALSASAAAGNSYTAQTLFETYISIPSFENIQSGFNTTGNGITAQEYAQLMLSPTWFSTGTYAGSWMPATAGSTTADSVFSSQYLYLLTNVGGFSPRDVGNLIPYTTREQSSLRRSYYFQLGSYLMKMYQPNVTNRNVMTSIPSIANSDFATTSAAGNGSANYKWADFKGSFAIGADNNTKSDANSGNTAGQGTVIGSGWSNTSAGGIYYSNFNGNSATVINNTNVINGAQTVPSTITTPAQQIAGITINTGLQTLQAPNLSSIFSSTGIAQTYYTDSDVSLKISDFTNSGLALSTAISPVALRNAELGFGRFKTRDEISQSFFTNSLTDVLTRDANDGSTILQVGFRGDVFDYTLPTRGNFNPDDWRILATNVDPVAQTATLTAQVKNPATGDYVSIPQSDANIAASTSISGFGQLPTYVIPVAVAVPIVIVAIALGLGLGIGIPMQKNKKALKQGFEISNKKVDTLTTAVGSVFKQIINRTQIGNIKKSPQLLKKASPSPAAKPAAPGAKPAAPSAKPAAPAHKPVAPTAKPSAPSAPAKPVSPTKPSAPTASATAGGK
ncbi:hypothetical protein [[Mycoplasma] testudinis]|uniref:hypothetical protein n=1 Tax=[Mycoplasma] testudinis TaxID=33924 RepID=UPI0004850706|nr:hypothetical protein [[Mycoplasma] testudinis]